MRNILHEPIFFTPPTSKVNRRLFKSSGGGGDGGAADRQAAEDARIAAAVNRVNEIFGIGNAKASPIDKSAFTHATATNASATKNGFFGGNSNNQSSLGNFMGRNTQNNQPRNTSTFDQSGYDAAVSAEDARVARLQGAGAERDKLYSTIGADTTNNLMTDLNKQNDVTNRELNFNLARNGLAGGSRDVDSHRDVLDTFNQGALKASNLGTQSANNARHSDDTTRTDIISRIRAGLDQDNAIQQSTQSMKNNMAIARDNANTQSLTGFFTNIRNELDRSQYNQGLAQATPFNQTPAQSINKTQSRAFNGNTLSYG